MDPATDDQPARGAFIVLEGLDRSGKTTQVKRLGDKLVGEGKKVEVMQFPDRTTPIGQMIDAYLKSDADMDDHVIHLLFSANRWEAAKKIETLLAAGRTIICDRYYHSGIVYSAAKLNRTLPLPWARAPETGLPRPDVVVFLDVDEETARSRGGWGDEKYEKAEMQKRVRELFWGLSMGGNDAEGVEEGLWKGVRLGEGAWRQEEEDLVVVDASGSVEDVAEKIWAKVSERVREVEAGEVGRVVRRVL